jgi:hypothetical protein
VEGCEILAGHWRGRAGDGNRRTGGGEHALRATRRQGARPFQAHQWQEAHLLFNEALQADPDDPVAAYYRGLCEARLATTPTRSATSSAPSR